LQVSTVFHVALALFVAIGVSSLKWSVVVGFHGSIIAIGTPIFNLQNNQGFTNFSVQFV
jgi:hypothetical protein